MIKIPLWKRLPANGKMKSMFHFVDMINIISLNTSTHVPEEKRPEIELKDMTACYLKDIGTSLALSASMFINREFPEEFFSSSTLNF